jgi:hypothetical protein
MRRASNGRPSTAARGAVVAAAAAVCLGLLPASAAVGAAVTIGASDLSSTQVPEQCPDKLACTRTLVQLIQPTPGVLLTAPGDGVITAWRVHGNTAYGVNGALALRVLRRDPDGVRFAAVATSDAVTASQNDGSPAHAVSIAVQAGDYIGVDVSRSASSIVGAPVFVYTSQPSGATYGVWEGGLSAGLAAAPSSTPAGRLMLNAVESLRPAVSAVSLSSGSTSGGDAVTITGSNLDGATGVSFGGTPATTFTASATQITVRAPARAQGTVHVQVTSPGGQSLATSADLYSYVTPAVVPPSIAIASPANGAIYAKGQALTAAYSCVPPAGVTVTICVGPVANGALIDTSTLGSHTFTVNAQDSDGAPATKSAGYTVVAAGPIISGARETAKTWRENNTLAHTSAKKKKIPVGTTFSFALNEGATVTLGFTRQDAGRKVHRACVPASTKNRNKPRCTRAIAAGSFTFSGHPGVNRVRFAGRISPTSKLKPGRYTLQIGATDTQRTHSAPQSLTFTIVR